MSLASAELVRDHLPERVSLRELGEYRLKDLIRPERIFQVVTPDLPAQFSPLKTLETFQHNLPVQLTSFVGREAAITEVKRLLFSTRLLTLTGAGGVGKTRLALQLAVEQLEQFEDGVWLIELAPLSDPQLVPDTIIRLWGLRQEPDRTPMMVLADHLRSKRLLLVLDNCEHLIEACAILADKLLRHCPGLRILATSREALNIGGEIIWRVPSLSLPSPNILPPLEQLSQYEAVKLFIDRATAAQPDFRITNHNAPTVAQLCHQLDGIPLALELAAARVKSLTIEQIAQRLDDRFRLLTGGSRTALPRQQTLKAAIDWSYNLLGEKEQVLLRRLTVFGGGWKLEAAEAVCAGEGLEDYEVIDFLQQLVNKSLVMVEVQVEENRYRLLETIREYAMNQLQGAGELELAYNRYLNFFLSLAQQAEANLDGPEQIIWFDRLERDCDNFRAALRWALTKGNVSFALDLSSTLSNFWLIKNYYTEGRKWLEEALANSDDQPLALQAKALHWAGILAHIQSDSSEARILHQKALMIGRELGDKTKIGMSLNALGLLEMAGGNYERARSFLEEAVEIERELKDRQNLLLCW